MDADTLAPNTGDAKEKTQPPITGKRKRPHRIKWSDAVPRFAYGLVDPRDGIVRYIGVTSLTLKKREAGHVAEANRHDGAQRPKNDWVRKLLADGIRPMAVLIESIPPGSDWQDVERRLISYYRAGSGLRLLNNGRGGSGPEGCVLSLETRSKMSASRKGKKRPPHVVEAVRLGQIGRTASPEARAKMRAAKLGKRQSPETIAKRAAKATGRKRSEETCRNISESLRGKTHSAETRAKLSAAHKGRPWSEPQRLAYLARKTRCQQNG